MAHTDFESSMTYARVERHATSSRENIRDEYEQPLLSFSRGEEIKAQDAWSTQEIQSAPIVDRTRVSLSLEGLRPSAKALLVTTVIMLFSAARALLPLRKLRSASCLDLVLPSLVRDQAARAVGHLRAYRIPWVRFNMSPARATLMMPLALLAWLAGSALSLAPEPVAPTSAPAETVTPATPAAMPVMSKAVPFLKAPVGLQSTSN